MPELDVTAADARKRLDLWLCAQGPSHSRARWQDLVRSGHVLVNGEPRKPHYLLREGDHVAYQIPAPELTGLVPEARPLSIVYEDADVIVLDKPPDLVVHPAPGHPSGTLVNALLHHCTDLAGIGGELRPGIVHRLDKDTSGVMVVAKNDSAMNHLARQFKQHEVKKEYLAVVWGHPEPLSGTIESLIGRSLHNRKKMTDRPARGRRALTRYSTVESLDHASLLRVGIETGRTHQIRVHLASRGHPVVGDRQYGRARATRLPVQVGRQMLHAHRLGFVHPGTGEEMEFEAPMPEDMQVLVRALRGAGEK
jgi:23S rRNA pseudouridine1911/1915/1917 synthase